MQQPEPELHGNNRDVCWMIDELLRLAVVEEERVVDHHEIHVGIAPVDQRVAQQEKRCRKAQDDRREAVSPAEKSHPVEGVSRLGLLARRIRGRLLHARVFKPANGSRRPARGRFSAVE
jgi:hypothetical protein